MAATDGARAAPARPTASRTKLPRMRFAALIRLAKVVANSCPATVTPMLRLIIMLSITSVAPS